MHKKKIIVLISVILFILISITILFLYKGSNSNGDYERAKKETLSFLDENIKQLEELSKESLSKKYSEMQTFKTKEYYFDENNGKEYIVININAQGMLGGQYLYLLYCEDDFLDGKNIYIYDEYKETGSGNNIFIVEKIKDNWYFYYQDWDGKVDITKIEN